jgi:limonene-1,2-epoxide hydrolase
VTDLPTEPGALVASLADAWAAADLDRIMVHFTDDAVYENVGMGAMTGAAEIRAGIEGFLAMGSFRFDTLRQVVDGGLVMNERVDTISMDGNDIALRLMGVFETRDGKIAAWRDYFDMSAFAGG